MEEFAAWIAETYANLKSNYDVLVQYFDNFVKEYSNWGPLAWIFLSWLESVIPILLLSAIAMANVAAAKMVLGGFFGFVVGYLTTWIGTTLGAITMFSFWRYLADKIKFFRYRKNKKVDAEIVHESNQGFIGLFTISAIPLVPSSLINFTYALSRMKTKTFMMTTIAAKSIMTFIMCLFAEPLENLFRDLTTGIITAAVLGIIFYILNKFENQIISAVKKLLYKSKWLRSLDERSRKEQ